MEVLLAAGLLVEASKRKKCGIIFMHEAQVVTTDAFLEETIKVLEDAGEITHR